MENKCLVSTEWLEQNLSSPDLVVVDASWHLPTEEREARKEYLESHIPGAVFFDIDKISDKSSELPHMLPGNTQFSSQMRKIGIGDGKKVVVYDSRGLFSAARGWWTFRVMGVTDVAVLDGGLPKWVAEDRAIDSGEPIRQERHFTARRNSAMVRDVDDIHKIVKGKVADTQIVDARPEGRFRGTDPEPRAGLRSGRIPGSLSLPFGKLMNSDGTLKAPQDLRAEFEGVGMDFSRPIVTTCGSGVTAAILSLALEHAGHRKVGLYDGSWSEWGARPDLPIEAD